MYDFLNWFHMEAGIPQNPGTDFNVNGSDLDPSYSNTNNLPNTNSDFHNQTGLENSDLGFSNHSNLLGYNCNNPFDHNGNNLLSSDAGNLVGSEYANLVGRNYDSLVERNFSDIVNQDYGSLINRPLGEFFVSRTPSSDDPFSGAPEDNASSNNSNINDDESNNRTVVHSATSSNNESGNPRFGGAKEEYEAQKRKLDDLKSKLKSAQSKEKDKLDKVETCMSDVKFAQRRWEKSPPGEGQIHYKNTLELNEKWYNDAVKEYRYAHEDVEKLDKQVASLERTVRDLKNKIDK